METADTSTLEPAGLEHKFYAQGVGNILTIDPGAEETLPLIQIVTE